MSSIKLVDGFNILFVKYQQSSKIIRNLFIKEHKVRETNEVKPEGRTLFVINIPPFVDESCMRHLFNCCGRIKDVMFHERPNSSAPIINSSKYFIDNDERQLNKYKVAYVVFDEENSLKNALNLSSSDDSPRLVCPPGHVSGVDMWKREYNDRIVNVDELRKEIDEYMNAYDRRVEEDRHKAKEQAGLPDEQGWVTVTKHGRGRKSHISNKQTSDDKIISKVEKKKKHKNQLNNFYTFQLRESKINHLAELRKRFQEDKKKIAIMKASRKFKPF